MIQKIVEVKYGKLMGTTGLHDDVRVFRGIPYAKAPVGELRWRRPQPAEPWEGVRDAREYGNRCMQFPRLGGNDFFAREHTMRTIRPSAPPPESEDGLYLNIWTSAENADSKLPVVVNVHGGAFCFGSGADIWLEQETLCRRGIVVVSFNYRVGVMGFLAYPGLAEEDGAYGNYGLYDQIAAVQWVRENIAAFGGDPDAITIMGNSAGGKSIEVLNCSELTKGLYRRAILESSGGVELSLADAVEEAGRFVELLGVKDARELRALPIEKIMEAYHLWNQTVNREQRHVWVPTVDHVLLKDYTKHIIESGKMNDIEYLFGVTMDDMDIPEMFHMAQSWAKCQAAPEKRHAYFFYFDRRMPGNDPAAFAYHGVNTWYLHGMLQENWRTFTDADHRLAEAIQVYWSNFIRTGDPNQEGCFFWKPYTAEHPGALRLGLDLRMDEKIDPLQGEECPHVKWAKSNYQ